MEIIGHAAMERLGERFGQTAAPNSVFALCGDLGMGKSVFARGIAKGLGVTEPVPSPTFTILVEHGGGRLPFYHFDLYRIESASELDEIGFDDCLFAGGVTAIEWPERARELLSEYISVRIAMGPSVEAREVEISGYGKAHSAIVSEVLK